jgi:hypothetical protein
LKGADAMLSVVEKYVTQIKKNRERLNENVVECASITIFDIAYYGSTQSEDGKGNVAKKQFEQKNRFDRLVDVCKFLISQPPSSPKQKNITNNISIAVCRLLKSEKPPLSFGPILAYVDNLRSSPLPSNGYDDSAAARGAWKEMIGADDCVSSYKKQ